MSFAAEHASAYADVSAVNPTTFDVSRSAQGAETANGTFATGSESAIACVAFAKRSNPDRLRELGLVVERTVTLFLVPETFGLRAYTTEFVMPNDTLPWNGVTMTVRAVGPLIALDGIVVAATIIASV